MVCCALLAILLASPVALRRAFNRRLVAHDALAWRLHGAMLEIEHGSAVPPRFSLRARAKSVKFAAAGLLHMVKYEHNARIHSGCALTAIGISFALGLRAEDWRWIIAAILCVWAAEALNTAIEGLCDLVSPGHNERVRVIKDVAAGAVLMSAIAAATIGMLTFCPYLATIHQPLSLPWMSLDYCWHAR